MPWTLPLGAVSTFPSPRSGGRAPRPGRPAPRTGSRRAPCRRPGGRRRSPQPAAGPLEPARAQGYRRTFMQTGSASRNQIRVLIADDDRGFLTSLRQLIERQPELSVVGAAEDGLEAIELADDLDPDAVVIDLHMPLLDGVTAAARLRRDHPNVCLIALTGGEAPELHKAVREAGADEVLLKTELVEGLVERLSAAREKV